jgi:hypothetical protein
LLDFDWTYPHSYEVEELREIPGSGVLNVPAFYIPTPKGKPEHDGLWLKFRAANGKAWLGIFAFGYASPPAFSRVLSLPNPDQACVIANGKGFLVTPDNPEEWAEIPILPLIEVRSLPEHEIVVFGDFTRLAAYASSGLVWRSPRVCWDELRIVTITQDTIEGSGYDPTTLGESRFLVDLKTGRSLLPPPVSTDGKPVW